MGRIRSELLSYFEIGIQFEKRVTKTKQAIRLIGTNTAIVFCGYLEGKHFDEIIDKIENISTEDKCDWLINFLEERNFYIVDICSNAARFPDSPNTIII